MLTPKQDKLVMTLPNTVKRAIPRSLADPPHRACRMMAFQRTIKSAPFSFGSQPQNRPHDWSAQIPPRIVATKLNNVAKQTTPYIIRPSVLAVASSNEVVNNP